MVSYVDFYVRKTSVYLYELYEILLVCAYKAPKQFFFGFFNIFGEAVQHFIIFSFLLQQWIAFNSI